MTGEKEEKKKEEKKEETIEGRKQEERPYPKQVRDRTSIKGSFFSESSRFFSYSLCDDCSGNSNNSRQNLIVIGC